MRRSINFRFLAYLFAGIASVAVGVHFLHGYQVKRNAGVFLEQADRAEEEKHLDRAADLLGRYLAFAPHDTKVLARYGLLLDQLATSPRARLRAFQVLERVLREDPELKDMRRRQAKLAISLRLFGDAQEHLEKLRTAKPSDAEVEELLGQCYAARGKYPLAREAFENAIKLDHQRIDSYVALARLYQDHKDEVWARPKASSKSTERQGEKESPKVQHNYPQLAKDTIDDMVKKNPDSYRAYLNRALYLRNTAGSDKSDKKENALADAEKDLEIADQKSLDEADVLLACADLAQAQQKTQKARNYLARGCAKHPKDARMYQMLGRLELEDGKAEAAVSCLRNGLRQIVDHPDLQWDLANTLIEINKLDEAAPLIERLRKEHMPPAVIDFLQARLRIGKKEWLAAIRLLERAYPLLAELPQRAEQAALLQAFACEKLGDADQAYSAYLRVTTLNPLSIPARLGAARLLTQRGQIPEAFDQLRQLYKLPRMPVAGLTLMAHLMIVRNRQSTQPDWGEVLDLLNQLEKAHPSDEVTILRAEVDAERNELARARERLERASDEAHRSVELWTALAALEERQQGTAAALAFLDQAEKRLGTRSELLQARLRHLPRLEPEEARKGLAAVARQIEKLAEEDQGAVLTSLAAAYARLGDSQVARRFLDRQASQQKDNLLARIGQFDMALAVADHDGALQVIEDMRRIEGPGGSIWRFATASHLLAKARTQENLEERKRQLNEARALLLQVRIRRPKWSRIPLCQARIDDLLGKTDAALTNYLQAIRLGDRDDFAIQRAAQLLTAHARYAEAYELLRMLPMTTPLSDSMQKLYAEVTLQSGNNAKDALELARKAVDASPKDYQHQLWYGRMLWRAGRLEEAEDTFRLALRLAEDKPESWVTLVQYLVTRKRMDDARGEIEKARLKLPKDQAALALAQCYEAVGELAKARQYYEEDLAVHTQNIPTLQGLAGVCLRTGDLKGAQNYLQKILKLKVKDPVAARAAQRTLALVIAAQGDYKDSRTALALMGLLETGEAPANQSEPQSAQDLRTQALLLTMAGTRKNRQQAIGVLEKLVQYPEATLEDRFLLAQLYEVTGMWPKARKAFQVVLTLPRGEEPRYLAFCAQVFLMHDETEIAEELLAKLAKQEPTSLRTTAVRARLLKAQGKSQEAVDLLQRFARGEGVNLAEVAALLESLEQWEAAERMYRKYVEAAQERRPESVLILAQFLGRRGRLRDALDLCEGAWKTCPPIQVTQVSLLLIATPGATAGDWTRVERWLQAEIAKNPKTGSFLVALAHLRTLQGRYDEAEKVYQQALAKNPKDTTALNNLAYLLALRGVRLDEALQLVDAAYERRGPRPSLLDTRAVIYLKKGDSSRAIKDLTEAAADAPSPSIYFHLAEARCLIKDRAAARVAFQQALNLGLNASSLLPLEKETFDRLMRELPR